MHTRKQLTLHNKLEVTWKKKKSWSFLGVQKTYAPKPVCLYVDGYFNLPRNYMYASAFSKVHCVCCWQEALPNIIVQQGEIFSFSSPLFPLYSSPSTSHSLPLTSYLHVSLFFLLLSTPPLARKPSHHNFALRSAIICIKFLINIKFLVNIIVLN